jgi:hypothetical protein
VQDKSKKKKACWGTACVNTVSQEKGVTLVTGFEIGVTE